MNRRMLITAAAVLVLSAIAGVSFVLTRMGQH